MVITSLSVRTVLCILLIAIAGTAAAAQEFPGRKLYPEVPIMEIAELEQRFDQVMIVDVRSEYEFDTLRIKGAALVPVSDDLFTKKVAELRNQAGNKPLVFYCNGHTCEKSYQAVRKASFARITNLYAYDAGIFDWAKNHPDKTELFGKQLDIKFLISDEQFQAHLLEPDEFTERASTTNSIILDIRDRFQREGLSIFSGKERSVSLDNTKLKNYVDQAKRDDKTLFIYDAAGHQVKWLQYFLESHGLTNYYFMKGGAKGFYDQLRKDANLMNR